MLAFHAPGSYVRTSYSDLRGDIATLVLPSRARAIELDRAYLANVIEQSFVWGRDAADTPAPNTVTIVDPGDRSTGVGEADRVSRDGRLHLTW